MRVLSIRQLQRNFYEETKNLPILVTKRVKGKGDQPFVVILAPSDIPDVKPARAVEPMGAGTPVAQVKTLDDLKRKTLDLPPTSLDDLIKVDEDIETEVRELPEPENIERTTYPPLIEFKGVPKIEDDPGDMIVRPISERIPEEEAKSFWRPEEKPKKRGLFGFLKRK